MRWLSLIFALVVVGGPGSPANAMEVNGCDKTSHSEVPYSRESLGEIGAAKVVEGEWRVIIDDSFRYGYLSTQTIQWLVFRACFFAGEHISESQSQDLYQAENADCWAARELGGIGYSDLDIQTIEYDLEVINKQASESDFGALLGPRRSPYLRKCL